MKLPWWCWRPICKVFGHAWGIPADFAAGEYCRCSRPLEPLSDGEEDRP